jgi:hypothetical protein
MTDTNQARGAAAKASRTAASAAEATAETLRTELPSSFVDLFDKTLARTKDMHEKVTAIFEHSAGAFEEAYSCANRGSAEYRARLMDIARQNANSTFDLAREACEAKSLPQLVELMLAHQRKQFELAAAQLKDLSALTQKVVTETTEPIRSGMAEPFRLAS